MAHYVIRDRKTNTYLDFQEYENDYTNGWTSSLRNATVFTEGTLPDEILNPNWRYAHDSDWEDDEGCAERLYYDANVGVFGSYVDYVEQPTGELNHSRSALEVLELAPIQVMRNIVHPQCVIKTLGEATRYYNKSDGWVQYVENATVFSRQCDLPGTIDFWDGKLVGWTLVEGVSGYRRIDENGVRLPDSPVVATIVEVAIRELRGVVR